MKKGNHNVNKNELSISFIIDIDGYYLYFGGDTMNGHIDAINPAYLEQCRFVKIPHHSSDTSTNLLSYLPQEIDTACTTIFSAHKLPKKLVLQEYCNIGKCFLQVVIITKNIIMELLNTSMISQKKKLR